MEVAAAAASEIVINRIAAPLMWASIHQVSCNASAGANSGATVAGPLLEKSCAENPFSYFGNGGPSVLRADKPDF